MKRWRVKPKYEYILTLLVGVIFFGLYVNIGVGVFLVLPIFIVLLAENIELISILNRHNNHSESEDTLFQITHEMIEAFNAGDMAREEELFQKAEWLRHYQYVVKKAKSAINRDLPYSDILQELKEMNRKAAE